MRRHFSVFPILTTTEPKTVLKALTMINSANDSSYFDVFRKTVGKNSFKDDPEKFQSGTDPISVDRGSNLLTQTRINLFLYIC